LKKKQKEAEEKKIKAFRVLITIFADSNEFFEVAKTIFNGCELVDGCEPILKRVQLFENIECLGFGENQAMRELDKEEYLDLELVSEEDLGAYDGYIFGFPSSFGLASFPFFQLLDRAGTHPGEDSNSPLSGMIGKPAGAFGSALFQHGGMETSLVSTLTSLFHMGCVICGCPYSNKSQFDIETITGITPYGVSMFKDQTLKKPRSESQTQGLIEFGRHIGTMAQKLLNKKEV
jgi:NAD(P)H dehydrogenase (quinone)